MVVIGLACGCPCCSICADDFTRADDTDISTGSACGWTETSGSWSISSNTLVTSSTSAVAKNNTQHPDAISSAVVSADLSGNSGDKPRILVDFTDASNYHFAQLTVGTTGCLSLYSRIGGTDTLLAVVPLSIAANTPLTVAVYFDGATSDAFSATSSSGSVSAKAVAPTGGSNVGLGTGSVAAACVFDNFTFGKYYQSDTASSCPSISVGCSMGGDTFSRADDTDIGCAWNEAAGTIEIKTNQLKMTASNSVALYNAPNPTNGAMSLTCSFKGANTNDVLKFIVGATDATTYFYAQVIIGTSKTLKLFDSAGTEIASTAITTTAGSTYSITVCLANYLFSAAIGTVGVSQYVAAPSTGQKFGGLACGSIASAVTFDDFVLDRSYDPANDVSCDPCNNYNCAGEGACCNFGTLPDQWDVVIPAAYTNTAGYTCCTSIPGTYTLKRQDSANAYECGNFGTCTSSVGQWAFVSRNFYTAPTPDPTCGANGVAHALVIVLNFGCFFNAGAWHCGATVYVILTTDALAVGGAAGCFSKPYSYAYDGKVDCSSTTFTLTAGVTGSCAKCVVDATKSVTLMAH